MQNPMTRELATRRALVRQVVTGAAVALVGSTALAISAWIKVPMLPVPMTMQTAVVLLLAAGLGPRLGAAAVGAYILEGMLGLPVLAGVSITGATAGYLAGFLLASVAVGLAAERGWMHRLPMLLLVLAAGEVLIYAPGLAWLHFGLGLSVPATVAGGLLAFLPGEVVKLALVGALLGAARTR